MPATTGTALPRYDLAHRLHCGQEGGGNCDRSVMFPPRSAGLSTGSENGLSKRRLERQKWRVARFRLDENVTQSRLSSSIGAIDP